MNLVDPSYELIDPCPDIHALFLDYNTRFFEGQLIACEVKWSPRMTSCAGVCSYQGRSGLCSIRLSKPLLSLRPRKDLVETLLHEMIHAYLFVTKRNQDRDGHGPEFQAHMYRINVTAGTNITIYHTFHAEVKLYKVHHWRCNGLCRHQAPFRGWVKRASNRAPGPNDLWWGEHQRTCGGTFVKVSEPPGFQAKKNRDPKAKKPLQTLDKWIISPDKVPGTNKISKPKIVTKVKPKVKSPDKTLDNWIISPDKKIGKGGLFSGKGEKVGVASASTVLTTGGQKLGGPGNGRSRLLDILDKKRDKTVGNNTLLKKSGSISDPIVLDDNNDEDEYWQNVDEHPTMDEWVLKGKRDSRYDLDESNLQIVFCPQCGVQEYHLYIAKHLIECTKMT